MLIEINNRKIGYHWEDRLKRILSDDSAEIISDALDKKYVKGSFFENGCVCSWKDITDDDIILFGLTQGWFDNL